MATSNSDRKINDLTDCSFCLSTLCTPKCLPCLHTFCLNCLKKYQEIYAENANEILCPLCREKFSIPGGALENLRDNFFIDGILGLRVSDTEVDTVGDGVKCDACAEEMEDARCPRARRYCGECDQNLCETCIQSHFRLRSLKSHKLVSIDERDDYTTKMKRSRPVYCEKHSHDMLRLYCVDCKIPVCVSCLLAQHNGHRLKEISEVSAKFRKDLSDMIINSNKILSDAGDSLEHLKSLQLEVEDRAQVNESVIKKRCDEIKRMIDLFQKTLLEESRTFRDQKFKEIQMLFSKVESEVKELESTRQHMEEMKDKGSDTEIICISNELLSSSEQKMMSAAERFSKDLSYLNTSCQKFVPNTEEIDALLIGEFAPVDRILAMVGLSTDGYAVQPKICSVNLTEADKVSIGSVPTEINGIPASCVIRNTLYAVGIGGACNELWAWSASRDEWTRCADMSSGRRRHCVTAVGDKIYVLGGWVEADKRTLDSILCYDINSNKWSEAGVLSLAVSSTTCLTYEHQIYLFGGRDETNNAVKSVQIYNPLTETTTPASKPMPIPDYLMKSVLWNSTAILIGDTSAYSFNFKSEIWHMHKKFKTDLVYFGLTVDKGVLYIAGGGTSKFRKNKQIWTCTNEVKSLSVNNFLENCNEAEWTRYTVLPFPALIHSSAPTALAF